MRCNTVLLLQCHQSYFKVTKAMEIAKHFMIRISVQLTEDTWKACSEIYHAEACWPTSDLIRFWFWSRSADFPQFGTILTNQIWALPAISGECINMIACNCACWCSLITFRADYILMDFICLAQLGLNSTDQMRGFRALEENTWKVWPKIWHGVISWPFSELIWWRSVDVPWCGATLT